MFLYFREKIWLVQLGGVSLLPDRNHDGGREEEGRSADLAGVYYFKCELVRSVLPRRSEGGPRRAGQARTRLGGCSGCDSPGGLHLHHSDSQSHSPAHRKSSWPPTEADEMSYPGAERRLDLCPEPEDVLTWQRWHEKTISTLWSSWTCWGDDEDCPVITKETNLSTLPPPSALDIES